MKWLRFVTSRLFIKVILTYLLFSLLLEGFLNKKAGVIRLLETFIRKLSGVLCAFAIRASLLTRVNDSSNPTTNQDSSNNNAHNAISKSWEEEGIFI